MTELQILNAVANNGGSIGYTELMNQGLSDSVFDPLTDRALIRALHKSGVLSGDLSAYGSVFISDDGRLRLRHLQHEAEEQAKQERQQRFDNKIAVANILVPLITFVLGILVEHYAGILSWILSLF